MFAARRIPEVDTATTHDSTHGPNTRIQTPTDTSPFTVRRLRSERRSQLRSPNQCNSQRARFTSGLRFLHRFHRHRLVVACRETEEKVFECLLPAFLGDLAAEVGELAVQKLLAAM